MATTVLQPVERYVRLNALHLLLGNLELEVGAYDEFNSELGDRLDSLGEQLWPGRTGDEPHPGSVDARVSALVAEMLAQLASHEAREHCIERAAFFARQARAAMERDDG